MGAKGVAKAPAGRCAILLPGGNFSIRRRMPPWNRTKPPRFPWHSLTSSA